ncbi:MAG: hypothetical protein ACKO37_05540 [Vampirovibrionales bacterium]
MTWQPIETAPKDGTPILGYLDYYPLPEDNIRILKFRAETWWDRMSYKFYPTHWMPLPPPAKALHPLIRVNHNSLCKSIEEEI